MLLACAVTALLMISCAGEKEKAATPEVLVPQDAQIALKLDVKSVLDKAIDEDNEAVQEIVEGVKMVMSEFQEKGELGIDLEKPLVLSGVFDIEDEECDLYMAVTLSDKAKFDATLSEFVKLADEMDIQVNKSALKSGQDVYEVLYDEIGYPVYLGVDKTSAVVFVPVETEMDGKDALEELYAQAGCPAYEGFDAFVKASDDLTLWAASDVFVDELMDVFYDDPSLAELVESFMPDMDMFEGSSMLVGLNFLDGKTVLTYANYVSEELAAYSGKFMGTASDKYFNLIPENAFLVANMAIDGLDSLFDSLMENEEVSEAFSSLSFLGINEDIFEALPGTITLAVAENSEDCMEMPEFVVAIECGEKIYDLLKTFVLSRYAEREGNAYNVFDMCYVAYVDGAIVAMSPNLWAASSDGEGLAQNFNSSPYASTISSFGVLFDLESISEELMSEFLDDSSLDKETITEFCSSAVFETGKNLDGSITLNMADKDHNLLEKIVELALEEIYY